MPKKPDAKRRAKAPKPSPLEVFSNEDYPQGSEAWKRLRLGIPTASHFAEVGRDAALSVTRDEYLRKLAGEIVSDQLREDFQSRAMERGAEQEDELRRLYAMITDTAPERVAFGKVGRPYGVIGASPDALIGKDGGLEIKSMAPHLLIEVLKADRVPKVFVPQLQGNMHVFGREWWDIAIGFRGMPLFRKRVYRDSAHIARLEVALEVFCGELAELVEWVKRYGRE